MQALTTQEIDVTLMGFYEMYRLETIQKPKKQYRELKPTDFEIVVAEILQKVIGGDASVTKSSGDYGVDIEHQLGFLGGEKLLGQVKLILENLDFEPIAILHSNLMRLNLKRGYLVTLGDYSENARQYAQWIKEANGVDIRLITGEEFVKYYKGQGKSWLTSSPSDCFIATCVYGDSNAVEVRILRNWRDSFLQKYFLGRKFITFYYKNGKKWADFIEPLPSAKKLIKSLLDHFVKWL